MPEPDSQPPTVQTYLLVFLNKATNNQLEMFLQFATEELRCYQTLELEKFQ